MGEQIKGRILIVDDQENWRMALVSLLATEGYAVETAAHFEEAEIAIRQMILDLVVLDVRLADTDVFNVQGLELLKLIKTKKVPPKVIILTGYPESIREGVLKRYGADLLILKVPPGSKFDSEDFLHQVKALVLQAKNE